MIYGNDMGWNEVNAYETDTFEGEPLLWDDNVSIGNHYHDYDGSGTYDIVNATHVTNVDRFPSISLNVSQANPISYEILETGNVVEWDAYALNPSHYEVFVDGVSVLEEEWDGGNIEYVVDGLAHGIHTIGVEVFHISGHSMENGTTADVEDLTPPELDGPSIIIATVGANISIQYTATDPSGIQSWSVNDTINFEISSNGLLTLIGDLPVGNYTLLLEVADPHGHATNLFITVAIVADSGAGGGIPADLLLIIGAGGGVAVLVIVIILYKTKKG